MAKMNRREFMAIAALSAAAGCGSEVVASDDPAPEVTKKAEPVVHDWPQFLGKYQNNTSKETGLLLDWPEEGPPLLWSRPGGETYCPLVVKDDKAILFHRIEDTELIECVDARDGSKVHWKSGYPTDYLDKYNYNGGPRSSPSVNDEFVVTYGVEGTLTCTTLAEGQRAWQRPVNKEYNVPEGFFGAGTAPIIDGDRILLNLGGPDGAGVAAFSLKSGETLWTTSNDAASYSTPIIADLHGERLAIFYTGDGLLVVEVESGKERYTYPFRSELYESAIAASPVLIDDVVFLSATYGVGAVALRLKPDGLEEVWRDVDAMQNHWATCVYKDGLLYGMDGRHERGSNFRCIDFATGEIQWTADRGLGRSSYIEAEDHLFAIGERGEMALIKLDPNEYIEKARFEVLDWPVWTPPILAHGLLYVRNEYEIKCFDVRSEARKETEGDTRA